MKKPRVLSAHGLYFALFFLAAPYCLGQSAGGLNWSVTPYLWASDTRFDLKADGTPVGTGKVQFNDLLDTTEASFQMVTEAGLGNGNWSAFADLTYLETADRYTGRFFKVKSDSEQWFVDAAVAWWPGGEREGFSVFAGGRYTDLDDRFRFSTAETGQKLGILENDRDFMDALVGVRQIFHLSENWFLLTHADYSSGDSEGIYQFQAVFLYGMGTDQQYGPMFGYRYKEAKFEHDRLEEKFKYQGPLLGFNFRF